jgi:enoyl-CoA hydratase
MTGCTVGAEEAKATGLVDLLAPEGGLDELVAGFAEDVLANSWHTNFATKRLMRETDGMSLAAGLAHEQCRHPGHAPDYRERIARFSRK